MKRPGFRTHETPAVVKLRLYRRGNGVTVRWYVISRRKDGRWQKLTKHKTRDEAIDAYCKFKSYPEAVLGIIFD